jgi:hypothetical protein
MSSEQPEPIPGKIHTVRSLAAAEPAFNEGGIRWTVFRYKSRLVEEGAIFFVGKKLFINRDRFINLMMTGSLAS